VISYFPAKTGAIEYAPLLFAFTDLTSPLSVFLADTFAFGMGEPETVLMVPESMAEDTCAAI
jgi:hypothetical protein